MSKDYEVGYSKPPKHTQFKPGRSGNPRGRPKGSRNFSTDLKATLSERVYVTKGGRRRSVSTQLATLMRLREKALSGDPRALDRFVDLARTYNDESSAATVELDPADADILNDYDARVLRRAEMARPDGNDALRDELARQDEDAPEAEDDDDWLR